MYIFYSCYIQYGTTPVDACTMLIYGFTGTLKQWMHNRIAPTEVTTWENATIVNNQGSIENNMIGKFTGAIVGEFGEGISTEDRKKLEINILLNLRCKNIRDFEQFHTEWRHRIQCVKQGNTNP